MKKSCLKKIIAGTLLSTTLISSTAIARGVSNSWVQNNSNWSYAQADGTLAKGWKQVNGTWYYFDKNSTMAIGWRAIGGTWYYLQSDGAMKTGWLSDAGHWYYLGADGDMKTGWIKDGGKSYYLNASGDMAENTTTPDGYYVDASGAWNEKPSNTTTTTDTSNSATTDSSSNTSTDNSANNSTNNSTPVSVGDITGKDLASILPGVNFEGNKPIIGVPTANNNELNLENGWVLPVLKSTSTDDVEKDAKILEDELELTPTTPEESYENDNALAIYYPQSGSVARTSLGNPFAGDTVGPQCFNEITFLEYNMPYDKWMSKLPYINAQLLKFYFPTQWQNIYNKLMADQFKDADRFVWDGREVVVEVSPMTVIIAMSKKGEKLGL